ncbi:MAG: DinB family protein [Terriglobales bacterium]
MMKRSFLFVIAMLCVGAWAQAQSLSPADRERAMKYLRDTEQGVIDATKGLSAAQWNFKPAPDRWSVAEVTEHIAATEDMLFGLITEQVMKAPPRPPGEDVKATDEMVIAALPDRSHKLQAPEPLRPTNRYGSPEASLKHFEESRAKTEAFLLKTDDLRAHAADSPMGKKLDGYEWILFIAGHSARHTKQILEVKADPNFPRM